MILRTLLLFLKHSPAPDSLRLPRRSEFLAGLRRAGAAFALLMCIGVAQAELTRDQKLADFRQLVDTFAKKYALYDWKQTGMKIQMFNIKGWMDRVAATQNDIEYFEICAEYVASLKDGHSVFLMPSSFVATVGFTVDLFEGKVLIDSVDRSRLTAEQFPPVIGDEILQVDGRPVEEAVRSLERFVGEGNPDTARRAAVDMLTHRAQRILPRAFEVGDVMRLVVRRQSGETANYEVPWQKEGFPVTSLPGSPVVKVNAMQGARKGLTGFKPPGGDWGEYFRRELWMVNDRPWVVGVGEARSLFGLGPDYEPRRGESPSDRIVSGIFKAGGLRIGYVRVPTFSLSAVTDQAVSEFRQMREVTDGLIVDVMRNPGGSVCRAEDLAAALTPDGFDTVRLEHRVEWTDLLGLYEYLAFLRRTQGPERQVEHIEMQVGEYEETLRSGRARTRPIPVCGPELRRAGAMDRLTGESTAYDKPVIVVVDEFSASAAEMFAAVLQDSGRALIAGKRTAGAGGSVFRTQAGVYGESEVNITWALGIRSKEIVSGDLPTAPYIENIGVRPSAEIEIMTRDNLTGLGRSFRERLLAIASEHIQRTR
jgi:C-terminal processing protease CtpA/Prc